MTEPVVAQKAPYGVEVESGKTYFSHSNGSHSNGSHSNGSHSDGSETHSEFAPMKFEAEESKLLYFCGCKASQNKPFCDGSHKKL